MVFRGFGHTAAAYDRNNAWHLEGANSLRDATAREDLAGKQRNLQFHAAPILPLTRTPVECQKGFDVPHNKMLEHTFLPAGACRQQTNKRWLSVLRAVSVCRD
jgi:hypothetical protein